MTRVVFLVIPILLFTCQAEGRQKRAKTRKNIQFTFTTTNRETQEAKQHFRVRIDRAKEIDIKVDADEEMVNALIAYGKSLTEHAVGSVAREFADGFYGLPVEKQVQFLSHLQKDSDLSGDDSIAREFANGFYELPIDKKMEFLIRLQKEFDLFGKGEEGQDLSGVVRGILNGVTEEPAEEKKSKDKPSKGTDIKALKGLADSIFGEGAVKEDDIKNAIDGFLKSGALKEPKREDKGKGKKPDKLWTAD